MRTVQLRIVEQTREAVIIQVDSGVDLVMCCWADELERCGMMHTFPMFRVGGTASKALRNVVMKSELLGLRNPHGTSPSRSLTVGSGVPASQS